MKKLYGDFSTLRDQRDAIDKLEGMPRRADGVGGSVTVPETYFPGAFGWTEHACVLEDELDPEEFMPTGRSVLAVPDEIFDAHNGKSAELDDGRTVIVDLSSAVDDAPPAPSPSDEGESSEPGDSGEGTADE